MLNNISNDMIPPNIIMSLLKNLIKIIKIIKINLKVTERLVLTINTKK